MESSDELDRVTFIVSRSGSVFGWGKNLFGQLGLDDNIQRSRPAHLKTLRSLGVRYVAAGDDFTVFLTSDGSSNKQADTLQSFLRLPYFHQAEFFLLVLARTANWVMERCKMTFFLE